ncbi:MULTISPECIES: hypothetical protein [Propionimicrobium]|nr:MULTISPECIES: hypothetical protein [Propionimicrobium]
MSNKQIWGSALVAISSIAAMNFGVSWAKTLMLKTGADGAAV